MRSRPFRHIIWDWNGTLLDDVGLSIDLMNGLLAERRLPLLDLARYHALFDFPVRDYYQRLGFDPLADPFERLGAEFIAGYEARRHECGLHAGAESLLAAIQAAGIGQSILSAYRQESLREIIERLGLAARFVHLSGLDDIYAHSKLEAGRALLHTLDLPTSEVLLIGDTLHDLEVAQALGVSCWLIASGHHSFDRLHARCADIEPDLFGVGRRLGLTIPQPDPSRDEGGSGRENPAG